ncbi:MAG: hypothetical protein L3K03_08015 [Thermoplasmata archaeon]|nr:hypothetical protein [Thermoplasmata archaeon]
MAPRSNNRWSRLTSGFRDPPPKEPSGPSKPLRQDVGRLSQVILGLVSIGFAIVVLATPQLSLSGLFILLAEAVALTAAQTVLAGGRLLAGAKAVTERPQHWGHVIRSWGIIAVGLVAIVLAGFAALDPTLATTAAVIALAVAMVSQSFGRIFQSTGVTLPPWLRGSALATGLLTVVLVAATILFFGFIVAAFAILVGVILLIGGIETVVAGVHPTDPRQFVLLKLILFSSFYGLILINWIDLPGKTVVPGYGIWLLLTYMAPFGVLLVFQGWDAWPLAASLGLLVSLNNDLGYFFVGNLIFGYHVALGPWIAGQLGFQGSAIVTTFQGGSFSLPVASWMMGASIYLRIAVVGGILYYWWTHPKEIVARTASPESAPASLESSSPLDVPLGESAGSGALELTE